MSMRCSIPVLIRGALSCSLDTKRIVRRRDLVHCRMRRAHRTLEPGDAIADNKSGLDEG